MKAIIFVALLICAPLTCYAAMSQAECPKDTIWNSSTNQCYQEKARLEAERLKEEQRLKRELEDAGGEAYKNMQKQMHPSPLNPQ